MIEATLLAGCLDYLWERRKVIENSRVSAPSRSRGQHLEEMQRARSREGEQEDFTACGENAYHNLKI